MIDSLFTEIKNKFVKAGEISNYKQDAIEIDPRYNSLGVRSAAKKEIFKSFKAELKSIPAEDLVKLSLELIDTNIAEYQGFGLEILRLFYKKIKDILTLPQIDKISSQLFGWSKIDSMGGGIMKRILLDEDLTKSQIDEVLEMIEKWSDSPEYWQRRLSLVCFTWGTAKADKYTPFAMKLCDKLRNDPEKKVLQGVGWCLSNHIKVDRQMAIEKLRKYYREKVSGIITSYNSHYLSYAERMYIRS